MSKPELPNWIEYAKLAISVITPIVTVVFGLVVLNLGYKIEQNKQLNQALLNKRLVLFDQIVPKVNDIFCFYRAVGHWAELNPSEILKRKRELDRTFHVNRVLFSKQFADTFFEFEAAYFETYTGVGEPAKLRLDESRLRREIGKAFKDEWASPAILSQERGSSEEQLATYNKLLGVLAAEVRGVPQ